MPNYDLMSEETLILAEKYKRIENDIALKTYSEKVSIFQNGSLKMLDTVYKNIPYDMDNLKQKYESIIAFESIDKIITFFDRISTSNRLESEEFIYRKYNTSIISDLKLQFLTEYVYKNIKLIDDIVNMKKSVDDLLDKKSSIMEKSRKVARNIVTMPEELYSSDYNSLKKYNLPYTPIKVDKECIYVNILPFLRNININCMDGQKKLLAVESIITGERVKIDALVRKCKSIMTSSTNQSMVNLLHSTLMEFLLAYTYIEKTIMIALIFKYRLLSSALTSTIDLSTFIMQRFPAGMESILENADSLSLEKLNDGTIRDTMLSGTFYPIDREVNRIIDDVKNTFKNVVCKCDGELSDDEDYHKEIYDDIVKELTDIESKISKISDADESVYDLTINEFRIKFAITSMVLDKLYGYISSISSVDDMLNTERNYVPNITKAVYYELCNFNTNMSNISEAIKSLVSTIEDLTDKYEKNEVKSAFIVTIIDELKKHQDEVCRLANDIGVRLISRFNNLLSLYTTNLSILDCKIDTKTININVTNESTMDSEYVMMAYDENNKCLDEYLYDKTKELTMQYMEARENIISGKRIMFVEANDKITVSSNNNNQNTNNQNNNNQNNNNQNNNTQNTNTNQTNNNANNNNNTNTNTTDAPSTNTNNSNDQNKTKEKSQTLADKLKEFVDKMIARFKEKLTVFKNKGHISWITKNKDAILGKNYEKISISTPIALSKGPTYLGDIDKIIASINSKQYDNLFGFLKSPVTITDNEGKSNTINKDNNFSEIVTNQYTSEGGKVRQLSGDALKKEASNMLDYIIKYEAIVNTLSSKINDLKNIKADGIPSKTMSDIRTYSASVLTAVEYKFTTYYKALVEISKQS